MSGLCIAVVVLATTVGELLVARGMREAGDLRDLPPGAVARGVGRAVGTRVTVAGVLCMAISFVAFLSALTVAPVSLVVPATAATYLTGTVGARWFLGEAVSAARWLGTVIVLAGVLLVSLG
jgi:multidrug transporter EmrE-like cation transporter